LGQILPFERGGDHGGIGSVVPAPRYRVEGRVLFSKLPSDRSAGSAQAVGKTVLSGTHYIKLDTYRQGC
jgi:hypothetical protein